MRPTFEDALGDLLTKYADVPAEEVMSALELALYALKDQADE